MGERMIEVVGVDKRYRTGEDFASYDTARDAIERMFRRGAKADARNELWALRDISLAVDRGEVLGVVGANGSGKTTLLKLVSGITHPSAGIVRTRGRVGTVLEIGTGFHPELTGRENLLMNAAILGMPRRRALDRFDEIVEFAGVEEFIDTPLKRYSAGMRLRLAFAVIAHVEPEILAIDEVLAVGDFEFQQKCLGKMSELTEAGRTALFVSHDHGAVTRLCSRAIWLDRGRIRSEGEPAAVVSAYLGSVGGGVEPTALRPPEGAPAAVRSASVLGPGGKPVAAVTRGEEIVIRLELQVHEEVSGLDPAIYLVNSRGVRVLDEAWSDEPRAPIRTGRTLLQARLPGVLGPDRYVVHVWVGDSTRAFQEQEALGFDVLPRAEDRADAYRGRIVQAGAEWRAEPG